MDFLPEDLAENLIPYEPLPQPEMIDNQQMLFDTAVEETPAEAQYFDNQGYDIEAEEVKNSESKARKRKRVKSAAQEKSEAVKKKKVRRRISPSTMKETYVEISEQESDTMDEAIYAEPAEKLTSSYVEKKSSPFKDKFKYTVIVVPENKKGHFRPVFLGYTLVNVVLGLLMMLLVVLLVTNAARGIRIKSLTAENEKMKETIDSMETNMVYLTSANAGLSDKVAVLSETVNQKTGELENYVKDEESKMTPKGFPFAGQAALLESTETAESSKVTLGGESESKKNSERKPGYDLEGYPIAIFSSSKGTRVIATANGRVKEVAADLCFGNRIAVEHGNGMVTIYRCPATPNVTVKQEVKQGDTLYETESDNEKLGYQIIKGNDYIDPLEMLEIFG